MATNIEIEAKVLINKDEYNRIVRKLQKNILKDKVQVNYYIDTKDFQLKNAGIGLRVRALNNEYVMTLKVPMSEGLLEKFDPFSKRIHKWIHFEWIFNLRGVYYK